MGTRKHKRRQFRKRSRKAGYFFGTKKSDVVIMNTADKKRLLEKPFIDIENTIKEYSSTINNLKFDCMNKCKETGCSNPDKEVCEQLTNMMNEKNTYDWVNLCKNAYNQKECIDYLDSYSLLETYANQITRLYNEQVGPIKQLLEQLKKPTRSMQI